MTEKNIKSAISEYESKRLLKQYNIPVINERLAKNDGDAVVSVINGGLKKLGVR